jgi:hypothetical protein
VEIRNYNDNTRFVLYHNDTFPNGYCEEYHMDDYEAGFESVGGHLQRYGRKVSLACRFAAAHGEAERVDVRCITHGEAEGSPAGMRGQCVKPQGPLPQGGPRPARILLTCEGAAHRSTAGHLAFDHPSARAKETMGEPEFDETYHGSDHEVSVVQGESK